MHENEECLSLYFEISENIYGRGVRSIKNDFENDYLYVHNTLLKHHEVLKMYHEQMPSLSEKM